MRFNDDVGPANELNVAQARIRKLERHLGSKTLETEFLKERIKIARKKTDLACAIAASGRFALKPICHAFDISGYHLHELLKGTPSIFSVSEHRQDRMTTAKL